MTLKAFFLPAPTGGMDAISNQAQMPLLNATSLQNVIARPDKVEVRGGCARYYALPAENNVWYGINRKLISYHASDGTERLILVFEKNYVSTATSSERHIYDITDATSPIIIDATKVGRVGPVRHVEFMGRAFFCDSWLEPFDLVFNTSTSAWTYTQTLWTGPTNIALLSNVATYKSRLYFCHKDSASVWYGGVQAVTGALTEFPVGGVLSRGGKVVFAQSTTNAGSTQPASYLVIGSSTGEILVYQGDQPGSSTWSLVGQYFTDKPVPVNPTFYMGGELHIVTMRGIIPISSIMTANQTSGRYKAITDIIEPFWARNVGVDPAYAVSGYFDAIEVPDQNLLLVQFVRGVTAATAMVGHLVMDRASGAWTLLPMRGSPIDEDTRADWICRTWTIYNNKLYGGMYFEGSTTAGDLRGRVGEYFTTTMTDAMYGTALGVYYVISHGYTYCDSIAHKKHIDSIQPIITLGTGGDVNFYFDADFRGVWSGGTTVYLDTGFNSNEFAISAPDGRVFSLRIAGWATASFEYSGTTILYEIGDVV